MTDKKLTRRKFMRILGSVSLMAAASSMLPFSPMFLKGGQKAKLKNEDGSEIDKIPVGRP